MKRTDSATAPKIITALLSLGLTAGFAAQTLNYARTQEPAERQTQAATIAVPPLLTNVHRIVCLGDSITQGGEGPGGYVWLTRHYLQALYPQQNIVVINAGISGHKSNDMLARYQRDVLDKAPDLITISVGVNDVWHAFRDFAHGRDYPEGNLPNGVPLDAYKRNVEEMVTRAQAIKAQVVIVCRLPSSMKNLDSPENARSNALFSSAERDIAHTRIAALFVDYQKPMKTLVRDYRTTTGDTTNLLTVDGVHMNPTGNRMMAHVLLAALGVTPQARAAAQDTVFKAVPK